MTTSITKGTLWTVWPRMIAVMPGSIATARAKMRSATAEMMPGTTAGRQASAKTTSLPLKSPEARKAASHVPIRSESVVLTSAIVSE